MKKNLTSLLLPLLILCSMAQAFGDEGRVIEGTRSNYEYNDRVYKMSHVLRVTEGSLMATSEILPGNTQEAQEFFEEVCALKNSNQGLSKKLTVTHNGFLTINTFECDKYLSEGSIEVSTVQFVVTVDKDDNLKDLQINQLDTNANAVANDPHKMTVKDGAEIAVAVAASTLASGLLARELYAGEHDKFLHVTAGSLVSAAATLLSYYGFNVSKNQAAIIGFATSVAVALLKEYAYDAAHKNKHTVDITDATATALGGAVGSVFIRLKFEF